MDWMVNVPIEDGKYEKIGYAYLFLLNIFIQSMYILLNVNILLHSRERENEALNVQVSFTRRNSQKLEQVCDGNIGAFLQFFCHFSLFYEKKFLKEQNLCLRGHKWN